MEGKRAIKVARWGESTSIMRQLDRLMTKRDKELVVDKGLEDALDESGVHLAPHQREGVRFMWSCLKQQRGCVLAHCMGLGKTLQVLALVNTMLKLGHVKRVLVVVPVSLVPAWKGEVKKWGFSFACYTYTTEDTTLDRVESLKKWWKGTGLLITTYSRLVRTYTALVPQGADEELQSANTGNITEEELAEAAKIFCVKPDGSGRTLEECDGPDLVVLDEAHKIKNESSLTARACKTFRTKQRIACTGTPMQNNFEELFNVVTFAVPGALDKKHFHHFVTPISRGASATASFAARRDARLNSEILVNAMSLVIHRRDQSVLRSILPVLRQYVIRLPLSDTQAALYYKYLSGSQRSLFSTRTVTNRIMAHPALFRDYVLSTGNADNVVDANELRNNAAWQWLSDEQNVGEEDWIRTSPKLACLVDIIRTAESAGDSVLVFSSFVEVLDMILMVLHRATSLPVAKLDGTVPVSAREDVVQRFQKEETRVLLLTFPVGGVGLNLTRATRVVLFETHWNYAEVQQAIFRAYRLGQTRPVYSYQLVCDGTFEHRLLETMMRKDWITRRVIDDETPTRKYIQAQNSEAFFAYTPSVPQAIPTSLLREDDYLQRLSHDVISIQSYSTLLESEPVEENPDRKRLRTLKEKSELALRSSQFNAEVKTDRSDIVHEATLFSQKKRRMMQRTFTNRQQPPIQTRTDRSHQAAAFRSRPDPTPQPPRPPAVDLVKALDLQSMIDRAHTYIETLAREDPAYNSAFESVGSLLVQVPRATLGELLLEREVLEQVTATSQVVDVLLWDIVRAGSWVLKQLTLRGVAPDLWQVMVREMGDAMGAWINDVLVSGSAVRSWVQRTGGAPLDLHAELSPYYAGELLKWHRVPKWLQTLTAFALNINTTFPLQLLEWGFREVMAKVVSPRGSPLAVLRRLAHWLKTDIPQADEYNMPVVLCAVLSALFHQPLVGSVPPPPPPPPPPPAPTPADPCASFNPSDPVAGFGGAAPIELKHRSHSPPPPAGQTLSIPTTPVKEDIIIL